MGAPDRIRLVPRIETYPSALRFARSAPGQAALLAAFAAGLWLHGRTWWLEMSAILSLTFLWPARRNVWIAIGSAWWWLRHGGFRWEAVVEMARREGVEERFDWTVLRISAIAAALLVAAAYLRLAREREKFPPMKRPVALLIALYVAMLVVVAHAPLSPMARCLAFAFLVALGQFLWFLAYALLYPETGRPIALRLGRFFPFWYGSASSPNPIPKAGGFLDKIEAKDSGELAVWRWKALKLLYWAGVLVLLRKGLRALADGSADDELSRFGVTFEWSVPTAFRVVRDAVDGLPHSVGESWLALVHHFLANALNLAIWSHVVVACCRMAGFKALRNVYRPLSSTSIAEFWNRYYYYFKELLLDVFFYPTFLRYFKAHPRVRRFAATLAAASAGNFLLHYLRDIEVVASSGVVGALAAKSSYAVYALALGIGIGISQLRIDRRQRTWLHRRVLAPAGVILFYCVLEVFDLEIEADVGERLRFLATLVGVKA